MPDSDKNPFLDGKGPFSDFPVWKTIEHRTECLDRGGDLLFTSPILYEYYQQIAVQLLDRPHMTTLGVLFAVCLPAFFPEWGLLVERIPPRVVLRMPGSKPIWPLRDSPQPVQCFDVAIEADEYAALEKIWSKALGDVGRSSSPGLPGHDGVSYIFGSSSQNTGLMTGRTWCPNADSDPGRIAGIAHSLKDYALANPVARPELKERIHEQIADFKV